MVKRFVEYRMPSFYVADICEKLLTEEEYNNILELEYIKACVAFRFFDIEIYTNTTGDTVISEKYNYSGWFYKGGKVRTLEDIREKMPGSILLESMILNEWDRVMDICGRYYPLSKEDMII